MGCPSVSSRQRIAILAIVDSAYNAIKVMRISIHAQLNAVKVINDLGSETCFRVRASVKIRSFTSKYVNRSLRNVTNLLQ